MGYTEFMYTEINDKVLNENKKGIKSTIRDIRREEKDKKEKNAETHGYFKARYERKRGNQQ